MADGAAGPCEVTDGIVSLRPSTAAEVPALVDIRDEQFRRFLGGGSPDPQPTACVVVDDRVVGWVDFDDERTWLSSGEVNLGYALSAEHRGRGLATRAVKLLLHHLAVTGAATTAALLIDPDNASSRALASRAGFSADGELEGQLRFVRPVPPLSYTDGSVCIRRRDPDDLESDIGMKDEEQIRWLWLPDERESWTSMTPAEQRRHAHAGLVVDRDEFGRGPKWKFSVDAGPHRGIAYVDCDLANEHVDPGEANISYACHPSHRGVGYVSASVRLVMQFLRDHTGARYADIIVDERNAESLRVATAVDARPVGRERWRDGAVMIRHRRTLTTT